MCDVLGNEIVGVFGPSIYNNINVIQSVCDDKDIPQIVFTPLKPVGHSVVNLYPDYNTLTLAYLDLVEAWQWKSFTILYEDNPSLIRMSGLMTTAKSRGVVVSIKQIDETGEGNYRNTLKLVYKTGELNFVIDCSIDILETVLMQAQQVGMMTESYSYIITNLDLQTINTEQFQYCGSNITGVPNNIKNSCLLYIFILDQSDKS